MNVILAEGCFLFFNYSSALHLSEKEKDRGNRMVKWYHPDSLLSVSNCFFLLLLTPSTFFFICPLPSILEPLHIPSHAFVQACVNLGQERHWLAVTEHSQPQSAELTLTNAEVRHAGKCRQESEESWTVKRYKNGM